MATIPFDEIVAGATVRFTTIDGVQYLSVRDVIQHLCGGTVRRASEKWERLSDDAKTELGAFCAEFQFPGRGHRQEIVITFKGALKLTMLVSGENSLLSISTFRFYPHATPCQKMKVPKVPNFESKTELGAFCAELRL